MNFALKSFLGSFRRQVFVLASCFLVISCNSSPEASSWAGENSQWTSETSDEFSRRYYSQLLAFFGEPIIHLLGPPLNPGLKDEITQYRLVIAPSFRDYVLLSVRRYQDEDDEIDDLILYARRFSPRSEDVIEAFEKDGVSGFARPHYYYSTEISSDDFHRVSNSYTDENFYSKKFSDRDETKRCYDGLTYYIEELSDEQRTYFTRHNCDFGYQADFEAANELIKLSAEKLPMISDLILEYQRGILAGEA